MKQAVVTGATGMLGAYLACELYQAGFAVKCVQHKTGTALFENICRTFGISPGVFSWVHADILDTESLADAFRGAQIIFHCAALVKYRKQDNAALYETNVIGTRNVCNAGILCGAEALVYASSIAAVGRPAGTSVLTENSPWIESAANTVYAETKHLAELEVWRASEEGLNVGILNPGVILGTGDGKSGSNAIFSHIRKGSAFYPAGRTGFVGASDVARAMVSVANNHIYGHRILLVAENLFYRDLLPMVAAEMGEKAPSRPLKGILWRTAVFLARFCEFFGIPFPFPSQGLVATAADVSYQSVNLQLLPDFHFTPIKSVIKQSVSGFFSAPKTPTVA